MSETTAPAAKSAPKLQAGQAYIAGKIDSRRQFQAQGKNQIETRVMLPAPDEYSSPATVAILSNYPLGAIGDEVQCLVQLGGYRDSYKTREGDTVQTARNVLRAVEL